MTFSECVCLCKHMHVHTGVCACGAGGVVREAEECGGGVEQDEWLGST